MFDKHFTPQEAEELIPSLERLTESIRVTQRALDAYDAEFGDLEKKIQASGGLWVHLSDWTSKRLLRETAAGKVAEEMEQLQSLGVLLKDFEMGLVDFPSLMGEEEIFLCWKSGESGIQFWHRTNEGYINRKPLTAASLASSPKTQKPVQ